jgi:hypothetical protein
MYMIWSEHRQAYKTYDGWTKTIKKRGKNGTNATLDGLNDTILFTKRETELNTLPNGQRWVPFRRITWDDIGEQNG